MRDGLMLIGTVRVSRGGNAKITYNIGNEACEVMAKFNGAASSYVIGRKAVIKLYRSLMDGSLVIHKTEPFGM